MLLRNMHFSHGRQKTIYSCYSLNYQIKAIFAAPPAANRECVQVEAVA